MTKIHLKRAYETPEETDGLRILVERLWPRGLTKEKAAIDHWAKDIAPSPALRKWYDHDVKKWPQFVQRYRAELDENTDAVAELKKTIARKRCTFIYAARDESHNSAIVLRDYLTRG